MSRGKMQTDINDMKYFVKIIINITCNNIRVSNAIFTYFRNPVGIETLARPLPLLVRAFSIPSIMLSRETS